MTDSYSSDTNSYNNSDIHKVPDHQFDGSDISSLESKEKESEGDLPAGVTDEIYKSELSNQKSADAIRERYADDITKQGIITQSVSQSNQTSSEDELSFKVPDFHTAYYAGHEPSLDDLAARDTQKDSFTETEAERFAMRQGLETTIRANARLHEELKYAKRSRQRIGLVAIALSILLATLLYGFTQYPKNRYIATKDNTAICGVEAHQNPNLTDPQIADFAKDAVLQTYTLDYVNYADQVEAAMSRYYTASGRIAQVKAFETAGTLKDIGSKAITLRAGAVNAPRIEEKGIDNSGKYFWVVRFPLVIDSYSGSTTPVKTSKFVASVTVKGDTATAQNPAGLGVEIVNLIPQ